MSKILVGVFSGIFIGAILYELISRANQGFVNKVAEMADSPCNVPCAVQPDVAPSSVE